MPPFPTDRQSGHFVLVLSAILLICGSLSLSAQTADNYPKGQVIDHLTCRSAPDQSYAFYLPSLYSARQSWPIIYAFDPGAQGRTAVEKFRKAAEKHGYIVVGSNTARNGPWEPIVRAAAAMWADTRARFALNEKRIYSTGFSGGARTAALFPKMIGLRTAGVIGCGAGIAQGQKTEELNTSAYCGLAGLRDSNYGEMIQLRESLADGPLSHRFFFFEGGHEWPPEEECAQAVEWMEIQAMRQNLKAKNLSMIEGAYSKDIILSQSWEERNPRLALSIYDEILNTYTNLLDTAKLREARERLALSKQYKKSLAKEKSIRSEERQTLLRFNRIFGQIENQALRRKDFPQILREFELDRLKYKAAGSKDTDRSQMAARILFSFWFDCRHRGRRHLTDKRTGPAVIFLRLAVEAGKSIPRNPKYLYYDLGCAYALEKNAKQAVKSIESAVGQGFDELHLLEQDHDFDSIRNSPEFQRLLKSLKN